MVPSAKVTKQICMECTLCCYYWGENCPGLTRYSKEQCAEIDFWNVC